MKPNLDEDYPFANPLNKMELGSEDGHEYKAAVQIVESPQGSGKYWVEVSFGGHQLVNLVFTEADLGRLFVKHNSGCELWIRMTPFGIRQDIQT